MVTLRIENATKKFGNFIAVKNMNLTVNHGEFVCLLGPSGCGKTTTLRCVAGLDRFTEGHVYFDDVVVDDMTPQERNVGMVFQFYVVYRMTVRENLEFPLKLKKLPKEEINRRVKEIANILRLDHLLDVNATKLNPAEKQRVALGRAIIKQPQILLLDEPLTNLDAKLRAEMRTELRRIHEKMKTTSLYVTHDQIEAMTMADRIAVMDKGVIQQYDTPHNLYYHPRNIFVAEFIGSPSMNFIECSLIEKDEKKYLDCGSFNIELQGEAEIIKREANSTESLILGIRPEHIYIVNGGEGYEGVIDIIENFGDKTLLHIRCGNSTLRVLTLEEKRYSEGEHIKFKFDTACLHVIDKKSGKVII